MNGLDPAVVVTDQLMNWLAPIEATPESVVRGIAVKLDDDCLRPLNVCIDFINPAVCAKFMEHWRDQRNRCIHVNSEGRRRYCQWIRPQWPNSVIVDLPNRRVTMDNDLYGYTTPALLNRHPVLYEPYDDTITYDGTRREGFCRMAHRMFFSGNSLSGDFKPTQFENPEMLS